MMNKESDKGHDKTPVSDDAAKATESDETSPPAQTEADTDDAFVRISELEAQLAELKDQYLRALAETENVRQRSQRHMEDIRKYSSADLAIDLLSVADNLRRALELISEEDQAVHPSLAKFVGGLEAIEKDFLRAFKAHHIVQMDPSGEVFDPNLHQAMMQVEDSRQPAGTVVQLMQVGYILHDRLLRPAMVGVAKGKKEEPPEGAPTA